MTNIGEKAIPNFLSYLITTVPVVEPPVPEVVAWVVVDVAQSPPSKWHSVLFECNIMEMTLYVDNKNSTQISRIYFFSSIFSSLQL